MLRIAMPWPLFLACAGPDPDPTDTDRADPPDKTTPPPSIGVVELPLAGLPDPPRDPVVTLGTVALWSFGSPVAEHHANAAFRSDGTLAVAWTWREYGPDSNAFVRLVEADGTAVQMPIPLAGGAHVAKPDVVVDDLGRALVSYESTEADEIGLERVDLGTGATEQVVLASGPSSTGGNNSVELTRLPTGEAVAAWNVAEDGAPEALYWSVSVAPDLAPDPAVEVAGIDNLGVSTPPDLAAVPGGYVVAWSDLREVKGDQPDSTVMLTPVTGGVAGVAVPLFEDPDTFVARPSIDADPDGRMALALPEQEGVPPVGTGVELLFVGADTATLAGPFAGPGGDTADQAVIEFLDPAHVVLAWSEIVVAGTPAQWGTSFAVLRYPDGEVVAGPLSVAAADVSATRPSIAVREVGPREYAVALSWEQESDADPLRQVYGRIAWITF